MQFIVFKEAVQKQFDIMKPHPLFRVNADKEVLYSTYLSAFPEGTNPINKERTEHDCNCCKSFIRSAGNMVAIIDGKIVSIWDVQVGGFYQVVADAMSAYIKSCVIEDIFLHIEPNAGTDKTYDQIRMKSWNHFHIKLPKELVVKGELLGTRLAAPRTLKDVMKRGLSEINLDAIDTVLELIAQGGILHRGDEKKGAVETFRALKIAFDKLKTDTDRDIFCWTKVKTTHKSIIKMRTDVLGTLMVDIVEGRDLEKAVYAYNDKVSGGNYKCTNGVYTKAQREQAVQFLRDNDYEPSLERCHATMHDLNVTNVLFLDASARQTKVALDLLDDLVPDAPMKAKKLDSTEEVTIDKFLSDILPTAKSIELFVENRLSGNFVSLIAPVNHTAKHLFKWDNPFSWSYAGAVASSIKERVKAAGGNVEGDLCCRLGWDNTDDLDLHMIEPDGHEIYYGNRRVKSRCGGILDLDANGADGQRTDPSENIYYSNRREMKEGTYTLIVHQFSKRESINFGFRVELDYLGTVFNYTYDQMMPSKKKVTVVKFRYSHAKGIEIIESLPSTQSSKVIWGLPTQNFHKVNAVMFSPNYWGKNAVDNKQVFFMLDKCECDEKVRPFYNEFLNADLYKHRKVFDMIGATLSVAEADNQLSGLGFSTTKPEDVIVKVTGKFTRTIKIKF